MGITTTTVVTCDICGRAPFPEEKPPDLKLPAGLMYDGHYDAMLYGWITLRVEHLCEHNLGHSGLPADTVVCPGCHRGKKPYGEARGV